MQKILAGVRRFQAEVFSGRRELFETLAQKPQTPMALFITCSDSRINPNLITQTEPGELFILRNAGNIIPPYGAATGSGEAATIEYAVGVLNLKAIIICGHWHCGAMQSLLGDRLPDDLTAVRKWFSHAEATRRILSCERFRDLSPQERVVRAVEQNVLVQIDNLKTHPSVATGLARGDLTIYGWVYRIETGEIFSYDPVRRAFVPLWEPAPTPAAPLHADSLILPTQGVS